MQIDCLTQQSPLWDSFLRDQPHDFYHLSGYTAICSTYDMGSAEAFLGRQENAYFFLPFLVRRISTVPGLEASDSELGDIVSPYGYAGPLLQGPTPQIRELVSAFGEEMSRRRVVSAFIRMHPLFPVGEEAIAPWGVLVNRGRSVAVDLSLSLEDLWHQTSASHRWNINKARRLGMVAEMVDFEQHLQEFLSIYDETMQRTNATGYYYFPRKYFTDLKKVLGDNLHLCVVRDGLGQVLCAGLFTEYQGIIEFHLSGTRTRALGIHPSKLMLDYVRRWGKERGDRILHLGSGLGGKEDSVFAFKTGFSSLQLPLQAWRIVFLPEEYEELCRMRTSVCERAPPSEYFPEYRS